MADKVIHEVRVIETDDGFRIEIKGDKERMRKMGFGPGFGPGFGWRRHRHGHHGHGWWGFGPGPGFGPWWDEEPEGDEESSEGV